MILHLLISILYAAAAHAAPRPSDSATCVISSASDNDATPTTDTTHIGTGLATNTVPTGMGLTTDTARTDMGLTTAPTDTALATDTAPTDTDLFTDTAPTDTNLSTDTAPTDTDLAPDIAPTGPANETASGTAPVAVSFLILEREYPAGTVHREALTVRPKRTGSPVWWGVYANHLHVDDKPSHFNKVLCAVVTDDCPSSPTTSATHHLFYDDLYFDETCYIIGVECWENPE